MLEHSPTLMQDRSLQIEKYSKLLPVKTNKLKISVVSSYLPRECGIATYTNDLVNSLNDQYGSSVQIDIYPLDSDSCKYKGDPKVKHVIQPENNCHFNSLINAINSSDSPNVLLIQHEFGLYRDNPENLVSLLHKVQCQKFTVLHTVLPRPSLEILDTIRTISQFSDKIIVMTEKSKQILLQDYRLPLSKIAIIPHGTHNLPIQSKVALRTKYAIDSKFVLATFGLLGPSKSIETTIQALPKIIEKHPDLVFLVLGKTHPELVKEHGEVYRNSLKKTVIRLGLTKHVVFIDKFLDLNELIDYLQLTDIYLFTSNDPNQAVSGTFAYAVGSGCPIVSTPIPHAQAVLKNGMGKLFDFGNSAQLSSIAIDLLNNEQERHQMKLNGLHYNYATIWENSALKHMNLFLNEIRDYSTIRQALPPFNLSHLKKLTTDSGILQFGILNNPDINSGYTTDDNARALIACLEYYDLNSDSSILPYIEIYLNYLLNSYLENDTFCNYKDYNLNTTSQNNSEELNDVNGRAIWALGTVIKYSKSLSIFSEEQQAAVLPIFDKVLSKYAECQSLRAISFMIKGIWEYSKCYQLTDALILKVRKFSDHMKSCYIDKKEKEWMWFENYLTYDNAVLSEAMLLAGTLLKDSQKIKIAEQSMKFLIAKTLNKNYMSLIKNKNWFHKNNHDPSEGGEQPIDAASLVLALEKFNEICPSKEYRSHIDTSFEWFLGKNSLQQHVYNHTTGGCHDGIENTNINLNQGAESTLSYILSRNTMERNRKKRLLKKAEK